MAMKKIKLLTFFFLLMATGMNAQRVIFVSPDGNNEHDGSKEHPLNSVEIAIEKAKRSKETSIEIFFRAGVYSISDPIRITSADFKKKKLLISAFQDEAVTISGGKTLTLQWKKAKGKCWETSVDFVDFDQLFINGEKRILARYPNYTEGEIFNGTSEDALSPSRVKSWTHPEGGFIHAMHKGQWGDMHYVITGKKGTEILYEGGFQNNRPSSMHPNYRFVENIREELDAPGEWFLDKNEKKLYYIPFGGENLNAATVEVSALSHLLKLSGTEEIPLRNVKVKDIRFVHTKRTFMKPYEQLMRSDWCIYRGAAVTLENTEDCSVTGCEFTDLGGNALFISRYNLNDKIKSNYFHHIGASAICVVGDISAVRSGSLRYEWSVPYEEIDRTPGAANSKYPRQCLIEDNLIHHIGQVEKQVAGVQIQLAAQIVVSHNTIYQVPRAAINVGDGAFGGHLIEYNDAFDTVLETSDHGAFNSWGRDRFWHPDRKTMDRLTTEHPELILLDARYTTILRNNRFRCDHGWDIDLDDGSSNYHIYNNVCLNGGIKLREGFYRRVENNIMINNSFHPHVWFSNCEDVFERNVVMRPYFPIGIDTWGKSVDYNIFASEFALRKMQENKTDTHSVSGVLSFADPVQGDYTLLEGNKAFSIGFENIPMDRFGVYSPNLKAKAEKPVFPELIMVTSSGEGKEAKWMDATFREVSGLGDRSAHGLPDEKGVIVVDINENSKLVKEGIMKGDVFRSINDKEVSTLEELLDQVSRYRWHGSVKVVFYRNQQEMEKQINISK